MLLGLIAVIGYKKYKIIQATEALNLFDGLFVGAIFFIIIPLCLVIFYKDLIVTDFNKAYSISATEDYKTVLYTLVSTIVLGICAIKFTTPKAVVPKGPITYSEKRLFLLAFILYLGSETIFFIVSGKAQGGSHWYAANEAVYEKGPIFVLLDKFHDVGRVIIPGILMYFEFKSPTKKIFRLHLFVTIIIRSSSS